MFIVADLVSLSNFLRFSASHVQRIVVLYFANLLSHILAEWMFASVSIG